MNKMAIVEDLEAISEGRMPSGKMAVRTTHGARDIVLRGTNGNGFKIPLDQVDSFIRELEQTCVNSYTLYRLGREDCAVEIPGFKVPKVARYLREARDTGVHFANYHMIF